MLSSGFKRRRTNQEISDEKKEAHFKEMIIQKKLSEFDAMKAKLASLGHPVKPQDQAYSAQNDRNSDALSARNESGKNVASSEKGGKPGPRRDASMEQIKK